MRKLISMKPVVCGVLAAVLLVTPAYAETIREMQQWWLDAVRVQQAQTITKGEGVVVAVVDTGIDATHPDLIGSILPGKSFTGSDGPLQNDSINGHGTGMAGIIVAHGGGANNALGVAPGVKILPIAAKVNGYVSIVEPVRWATDHGAKIINLSLAHPADGSLAPGEAEAIAYAQSKDVVVVVGAGNISETHGLSPLAQVPGVVAVSATTKGDGFWDGSAQGKEIAVSAPGHDTVHAEARAFFSTGYGITSGTSDSTAIVSGVLALIRAKHPDFNAANAINQLIKTADDLGAPGRDAMFGYGRVNAYRAVTETVPTVTKNPLGEAASKSGASQQAAATAGSGGKSASSKLLAIIVPVVFWLGVGIVVWLVIRARRKKKLQGAHVYTAQPQAPPQPQWPQPQTQLQSQQYPPVPQQPQQPYASPVPPVQPQAAVPPTVYQPPTSAQSPPNNLPPPPPVQPV